MSPLQIVSVFIIKSSFIFIIIISIIIITITSTVIFVVVFIIIIILVIPGVGIWPSGQSGGLARRRSRFDPRQGRPHYLWMYTPSAVSTFGWICALYKSS
jgi:hypothetical protein